MKNFKKVNIFLRLCLLISLFCLPAISGQTKELYKEKFRPQYHFSPAKNWMNDPNGLVFYKNEYHLFFQYNPFGNDWGHMSWGHAVSKDLVHWKQLDVAIPESNGIMAFSGSAVVDWNNTSGFGSNDEPPLVAIYTGFRSSDGAQFQCIAYSNDKGRTWTQYKNNPVIDIHSNNFRDSKVFWYKPEKKWVMIVSLSEERKIRLYESKNLKEWNLMSEFGSGDKSEGVWECPDLFRLSVDGNSKNTKWVLTVNTSGDTQYFIGEFDGKNFIKDSLLNTQKHWADQGKDFYAAQSYSDIPEKDGRRIWLGWMYNGDYGQYIPTYPWKNFQSVPRSLSLKTFKDGVKLIQEPVAELKKLREKSYSFKDLILNKKDSVFTNKKLYGNTLEIQAEIEPGTAEKFGFEVRTGENQKTIIGYDAVNHNIYVDRSKSSEGKFNDKFYEIENAPLITSSKTIRLHIYVDWSSVEVFAGDGQVVISSQIFPSPESSGFSAFAENGQVKIKNLKIWKLKSIWN